MFVHESGHLLAAVLVRLPVTAVRLRLIDGSSRVEFRVPASGRWLPVRIVAFTAAGPMADLLVAAGAYQGFRLAGGSAARAALLTVTVTAGVCGLHNLVPLRLGDGLRSDGASMLRWLLRPRAALLEVRRHPVVDRTLGIGDGADTAAHLDGLRAVLDRGGDPAAVGAAALALLAAYTRWMSAPIGADAARLAGAARSAEVDPALAAEVASGMAWAQSRALLRGVVLLNTAPSPEQVTATVELAELGYQLDPTAPRARYILAMARLWQGRVAEARELCRDAEHAGPEARATGLLVRALVEVWSTGDADAVGPLLDEAVRAGCPAGLAKLAGRLPFTLDADRRGSTVSMFVVANDAGDS